MADITPRPHVFASLANQNLTWPKVLAELVDNSFDAGASRVVVNYSTKSKTLTVSDDGRGVQNVLSVVTLGWHDQQQTTCLGMYGVGAKDAWLWCGDVIEIDTVYSGARTKLAVNYRDVQASGWKCSDPISTPCDTQTGTTITLPLRHGKNGPASEAFDRLAFIFSPALRKGLQIVRSGDKGRQPLEAPKVPHLLDAVVAEFDIDGKHVAIHIGILPDGEKMPHGGPFWLQYGHRIIDATAIGVGQYSASRLGGTITLGKGWTLTKNKDDLSHRTDALGDAIFSRIKHVVEKGENLAENIESQQLRSELENLLNEAVKGGGRRERRKRGDSQGSIVPANTGRKRTRAEKIHPQLTGSILDGTSPAGRKRGFILDWDNIEGGQIGRFDGIGSRVTLNLDHPFVSAAKSSSNRVALLSAAWALIADYAVTHKGQNKLIAFDWDNFAMAFSELAAAYKDGGQANAKAG